MTGKVLLTADTELSEFGFESVGLIRPLFAAMRNSRIECELDFVFGKRP